MLNRFNESILSLHQGDSMKDVGKYDEKNLMVDTNIDTEDNEHPSYPIITNENSDLLQFSESGLLPK